MRRPSGENVFHFANGARRMTGYGHSTPHTIGGKLFTMAYALVGIPLGLVMFQSIGERLNNFSSFVIRNVKRVLKYDSIEASETNLILVVTVLFRCFSTLFLVASPFWQTQSTTGKY